MRQSIRISAEQLKYILLCLSPILHMYRAISVVTWGEVLLVICILFTLLKKNTARVRIGPLEQSVTSIIVYYTIATLIGISVLGGSIFEALKELIVLAIYYVIGMLLLYKFDADKFARVYLSFGVFTALFVIIQYVFSTLWNISIPGLIPNVTSWYGNSTSEFLSGHRRCAAFFTEPAMTAAYLGIPLIISILDLKKKDRYISVPFVTIAVGLLLTLSGTAGITLIVSGIVYIKERLKITKKNLFKIICVLVIGITVLCYLLSLPTFQRLLSRVTEISGQSSMKSGYIRVVRGFVAFDNLPFGYKIAGIGLGNYDDVIPIYLSDVLYSVTDLVITWLNDMQIYLISGGVIGVLLYAKFLFIDFKSKAKSSKYILLLYLFFNFFTTVYCQPLWILFFIMMFYKEQQKKVYYGKENFTFGR